MIRLGILCPADIAINRFLPALLKCNDFIFSGVAACTDAERTEILEDIPKQEELFLKRKRQLEKAKDITDKYGGKIFNSYQELTSSNDIDAVYIPLPPALHYRWAQNSLENGKHVLLEKPFTTRKEKTQKLIETARNKKLAVFENYMFIFHEQIRVIQQIIASGRLGKTRIYDAKFGFPKRGENDFRYSRALGGGALLDCGGYMLKCAELLLGDGYKILYSLMGKEEGQDVDNYGSASFINKNGEVLNIAYGIDYAYQCSLRIWGSKAVLETDRFFTAPPQLEPVVRLIYSDGSTEKITVQKDDTFLKSILYFKGCIDNDVKREQVYKDIERQAINTEAFMEESKNKISQTN